MTITLQVCAHCGAQQYPRRDVCGQCLSPALEDKHVSARATVLSWSVGHFSVLPAFKDQTPLTLARVKLDGGAVVLTLAQEQLSSGQVVEIGLQNGLFYAQPV